MIASCGVLGLDWREAGLGDFMEAVEAHNSTGRPDKLEPASPEFRAWMRGRFKSE